MKRKGKYIFAVLIVVLFLSWIYSSSNETESEFVEEVKIALRGVGNDLLLLNQDSSSLVFPIKEIAENKFQLTFQSPLSFNPESLVSAIEQKIDKYDLPKQYIVEVKQCSDQEVAYSFGIKKEEKDEIIQCATRTLPLACYTIEVKFTGINSQIKYSSVFLSALILVIFLLLINLYKQRKRTQSELKLKEEYFSLGSFQFYPKQNKLVKQAEEINLSKKEGELLLIFLTHPNQTITRDELSKKVWEDKGVIVGRSLDTFISKLRKKLKDDESIQLINVHGVGYKLEIKD